MCGGTDMNAEKVVRAAETLLEPEGRGHIECSLMLAQSVKEYRDAQNHKGRMQSDGDHLRLVASQILEEARKALAPNEMLILTQALIEYGRAAQEFPKQIGVTTAALMDMRKREQKAQLTVIHGGFNGRA